MFPSLYAILDPSLAAQPLLQLADGLVAAGTELIQFRGKNSSPLAVFQQTKEMVARFASSSVRIIVNDRPDIAAIAGAGGVHVGQDDLPVQTARQVYGDRGWVGVSTHNLAQLQDADRTSADYIAVGPIFPTGTKENPDPVLGASFLRAARQLTRKPLVAIGGITVESAADVFRAGADSIAVIRDLLAAPDPAQRAREYLAIAERVRSVGA
ncbi:MAG TPA: thiamine phosphate synthase [Candidatus Acidoferrales bacterium]|nr:thiamine phosphate synthase [Candidatus Acidoferrales bacterium]